MAKESSKDIRSNSLPEQEISISSEDIKQCQDCANCKFRCIEGCC